MTVPECNTRSERSFGPAPAPGTASARPSETVVSVDLADRSYPIVIGTSRSLAPIIPASAAPTRVMLVSDDRVAAHYAAGWRDALESLGLRCHVAVIPDGEASKSLTWTGRLYAAAAEAGLDRHSLVIALGGGVVGDLAGFVAATYLRGLRLIQAPTSLLAMVDSSVGGKTAINIAAGKNLVGAFHQPAAVLIDLATLETLPAREYRSGLAEVVKYGAIRDLAFFEWLEVHAGAILARDPQVLRPLVARCCEIKADVVGQDEREGGLRAILNFGHTLGHAIETAAGYGHWLHGEAVALGMLFAARLSQDLYGLPASYTDRIAALLTRFGLPCRAPATLGWKDLLQAMTRDKKTIDGALRFVLLEKPGQALYNCAVEHHRLETCWKDLL